MENETYYKENFTVESPHADSQPDSVNSQRPEENRSFQSLLSSREILNESWSLYKARFKTLLALTIIQPMGSLMVLIFIPILYALFAYSVPLLNLGKPAEASILNILNWIFGIMVIVSFVVLVWFIMWNRVALIYAIKDSGENIGIKESFRRSRHKARQALVVSLLSGFITIAGYILFFVPGIIFSVWFTFAMFVIVEEDLKGMNVLLKCREYVRGYWWKILWRNLYIGGIIAGIGIIFSVLELIFSYFHLQAIGSLIELADGISIAILTPLTTIYQFILYKNIKAIKGEFAFAPSRGSKIKLIIIGIIGSILGVLMAIGIFPLINSLGNDLDKESKAYVDTAVPAIVSSWDPQELISRASPEFLENTSADKVKSSFGSFLDEFGRLKEYKGSKGETQIGFDKNAIATYSAQAVFEKSSTTIQIQVIKINGNWQIRMFQILPSSGFDNMEGETVNIEKRNKFYADIDEVKSLWSEGNYQEALDKASEVLPNAETDEDKAIAHYWIGLNQYKLRNYVVAESELKFAIKLDKKFAAPYVTLAAIEMDSKGDFSKALEYAEKCVSLDPKYAWCYNSKGSALYQLGQKDEGIRALEQAVSLDSDSFVFRDNLTRARQMAGQNIAEQNNASIDQNDAKRKADLAIISALLRDYNSIYGEYPISPSLVRLNQNDNEVVEGIRSVSSSVSIPIDPKPGNYYGYTSVDGKNFELTAQLENLNDPGCDQDLKMNKNICIFKLKSDL